DVADLDESILYIIVPRNIDFQAKVFLPSNVVVERELTVYDVINIADIHATINSTCVFEALALGKPSILIDYRGGASSYYYKIFEHSNSVVFVSNPHEFLASIVGGSFPSSSQIKSEGGQFFKDGFRLNISASVKSLLR